MKTLYLVVNHSMGIVVNHRVGKTGRKGCAVDPHCRGSCIRILYQKCYCIIISVHQVIVSVFTCTGYCISRIIASLFSINGRNGHTIGHFEKWSWPLLNQVAQDAVCKKLVKNTYPSSSPACPWHTNRHADRQRKSGYPPPLELPY